MRRVFITVVLIFFISSRSFSQIIIKEKVGINPQEVNNYPCTVNIHTFTYSLTWAAAGNLRGSIQIIRCNNDTLSSGWSTSGIATISFPANGVHHYLFRMQRNFCNNFGNCGWHDDVLPNYFLKASIDGIDLNQPQNILGHFNGINGMFQFKINDLSCSNATIFINVSEWGECNGPNWYINDPVNLQIIDGATHFSFYNTDTGTDLRSFAQVNYSDVQNVILKRIENAPNFLTPQILKIEANINGVVNTTSDVYFPNIFIIRIPTYRDTISFGDTNNVYIDVYHYCMRVPDEMKINVDLIAGSQYGNLLDPVSGDKVKSIKELEHSYGNASFKYIAEEVSADSTVSATMRISTTDSDVPYKDLKIFIKPPPLTVDVSPKVVFPGDTANVIIRKRNPDGTVEDFPSEQTFEIAILNGCEGGDILSGDSLGTYFYDIPQPIKFIAADSLQNDSLIIKLKVGLINKDIVSGKMAQGTNKQNIPDNIETKKAQGQKQVWQLSKAVKHKEKLAKKSALSTNTMSKEKKVESNYCFGGNFITKENVPSQVILKKDFYILLGETKYYGVKKKEEDGVVKEIKIEEIETNYGEKPVYPNAGDGWEWITSDSVWGKDPVSIVRCDTCGKRLGVYWETEKPIWDGNTYKGNLQKGLIRVVGRYWSKDSTYIVELKAKRNNEDSASIDIKVIKPSILSNGQSPTYSKSRDVFNHEYNVDSLCIYWGGLYGIPPQLIKGHMKKEAPPKNFSGYTGFAPSYRYEPYTTQFNNNVKNLIDKNNSFVVTKDAMGVSGAVKVPTKTEHYNVLYIHYPQSPKTVWQFINENSQLTNPDNPSTFGYRYNGTPPDERKKGQLHSNSYKIINKKYEQKLVIEDSLVRKKYKVRDPDELTLAQQIEVNDSARVRLVKFLRFEWKGNLDSIVAQTRIAASYGLLQNLYTTALGEGFKDTLTNNPEKLNEPEGFKYNIYHYTSLFKRNSFNLNETNNYVSAFKLYNNRGELIYKAGLGFEEAFRTIVFLWNTLSGYNKKVFEYMNNFLPRE